MQTENVSVFWKVQRESGVQVSQTDHGERSERLDKTFDTMPKGGVIKLWQEQRITKASRRD